MSPSPEESIQQMLELSSAVKDLRANFDDVQESRDVFRMAEGRGAETNFTITQLANPQCFAAKPLVLYSVKARTALALHYIGPGMAGHPGIVHGGVTSTILDECSGKAATSHFEAMHNEAAAKEGRNGDFDPTKNVVAVTAHLSIDFKNATFTDSVVITRATVDQEKSAARKATVNTEMWQIEKGSTDKFQLVASANGLFISPRAGA